jgi:UDP-2,3-diacylglucosamine pyrophosphatase LpxH
MTQGARIVKIASTIVSDAMSRTPTPREIMAAVQLAVTSDLHLPITRAERLTELADEMAAFTPDAVVLAGDLAESLTDFERCLALFRERLPCPVWVIPGNHDLWVRRSSDSRGLWLERLPDAVASAGCHWLEGHSFTLSAGDLTVGVAGTIAWYDYSAADPYLQASPLAFAQQKYNFNPDALLIDWEWSDPEFASMVSGPFLRALDELERDPAVTECVVVTHVPVVEQQMCRKPGNREWGFSNAYFGNLTLGRHVLARRKVSHIISGHTHIGREAVVSRDGANPVHVRVLPSDYEKPAWVGLTFGESEG